jgi:outer membrane receptor protein involved in Fe transport
VSEQEGGILALRTQLASLVPCLLVVANTAQLQAQTASAIEGAVRDPQGFPVSAAEITLVASESASEVKVLTDAAGSYRFSGLHSGIYDIAVTKPGFESKRFEGLQITVNRVLMFDIDLAIGSVQQAIRVSAISPMLDRTVSSSGATILPQQIAEMPINGRNYLDLMQLVPGIAINRQRDSGTDAATPVLGERGGNTVFLIDGTPNSNEVDGGFASPVDQNSVREFQVLTAGYKAEFGHGSGGVVNVVSRSGTAEWHGLLSAFYRNSMFDSSNVPGKPTPFLRRWDVGANVGGPVINDRVFFFGSLERIRETRELNFSFPPSIPDFLRAREETFNERSRAFKTRILGRLDEITGTHRITQQVNLTNSHRRDFLPLSQATSLPSTRANLGSRHLILSLRDSATLGDQSNPFVLQAYLQYRGEPSAKQATYPDAGPARTLFNMFSGLNTGGLGGDLGQVQFGAGFTPLVAHQRYVSAGTHLNKVVGAHDLKFGWDYQHTRVEGMEASNFNVQLFATTSDFTRLGPVNSGLYTLTRVGGPNPEDNAIRLRNNYNGLFVQDDWKIARSLTLNVGLRWDYDSQFPNRTNFSPRLGLAWSPASNTVVTASWGLFYDRYRLGLARDVPQLGGANLFRDQTLSFPRLFYGVPTTAPRQFGLCPSPVLTDTQISSAGALCPVAGMPLLGVDRLNAVVAPGHAPIAPDMVVTRDNVHSLTGLAPQQFADAASAAVGRQPGFFFWGGFGNLTINFPVPQIFSVPVTVDPSFKTPYTRAVHVGVQREIATSVVIQADYHHRDMRNILGARISNLAFAARLPGRVGELQSATGASPIQSFGPWYKGRYDAITVGVRKRMSQTFSLEAFYTWADAVDNVLRSSLVSELQTALGVGTANGPSDAFIGVPPVVRDPVTGQTNETGAFTARNGNPVPQAGIFYNGADLDRGPSDLALNHTLLMHGIVSLPWRFSISGIFRAQSGFHFSARARTSVDVDGDGLVNGVDLEAGRNHFEAPGYTNLDLRFSRRFTLGERVRVQATFELFNALNRANPAAVQTLQNASIPLGVPLQYLPGREGQAGLRFEF